MTYKSTDIPQPEESKPETTNKEILEKLNRQERTSGSSGAVPMMPKNQLLDARDVAAKHPDKRVRWVNLKNPDKAVSRLNEGYTRLTSEEGGRHLGDEMALFAIDRKKYEARVARQDALHKSRMESHNRHVEETAEQVAKILHDKYGFKTSGEELLNRG